MMGHWKLYSVLLVCALFFSCASRKAVTNETVQRDSVDVQVRIETIYVPDTVFVEIPPQKAERTTADSTSHLENDYAVSDARINEDGTLTHSLETKPQQKPVEFQKPVERKDSIVYRYKTKTKTVTQVVEVERDYSWWDKTRFYAAYALLLLLLIKCRKKIISLARLIFSM